LDRLKNAIPALENSHKLDYNLLDTSVFICLGDRISWPKNDIFKNMVNTVKLFNTIFALQIKTGANLI
jgi:hypothetical protein